MLRLTVALALALAVHASVAAVGAIAAEQAADWSAPSALSACATTGLIAATFPSDSPGHRNGNGAVVWDASATCPGGAGVRVASIGPGGLPGPGRVPRSNAGGLLALEGPLAVSSGPHGQILLTGSTVGANPRGLTLAGPAGGPFAPLTVPDGFTARGALLTRAYLGDVGLASVRAEGAGRGQLRLDVDRYYAHSFARDTPVGTGPAPVASLSLALDFRSDALVSWATGAAIYARDLPASGATPAIQRLGRAAGRVRIASLLSDDNRAIVAWSEDLGRETRVWLDRSASGVRFGSPQLLERFTNPGLRSSAPASPRLIRLSSESVMLAWAGAAAGHWVLRVAPIDLRGLRTTTTIAAQSGDALLQDLVPGPHGDAMLLWSEPAPAATATVAPGAIALLAARGFDQYPGRAVFGPEELVSPPADVAEASVAIDPASDRAIAVWRGEHGLGEYSIRSAGTAP